MGMLGMLVFAILLPTVDPVSLALEVVPLLLLFELSIWLSTCMEKRWDIADQTSRWSEAVRILSADWVLPVEGEPIENGAIAIEDGRIAAVGTAAELGEGERFPDAAIVPGFVNAHTHLEYAVYAGFGDGLSFGPWIAMHIERKARLDRADMEAIARLGAAECLRSGITTVGDLAFAGASAHACAALGLRAIVYLEVFGSDASEAMRQFDEKRAYVDGALSDRVRVGVSPHAPVHVLERRLRAPASSSSFRSQRTCTRARTSSTGCCAAKGRGQPVAHMLPPPDGETGIRRLAAAGLLNETVVAAHCVKVDEDEIGLLAQPRRRRHALPALERVARLRDRAAARAPGSRPACRRRHGRRLVGAVARLLRGAADGARARAGTRRARRRALRLRGARARHSRRRAGARARRRDRIARRPASARMSRSSPFSARRIYHGRIRRPPSSTAALRSASWLPSSTARHGTREEDSSGKS